jgi:hypothetical protein
MRTPVSITAALLLALSAGVAMAQTTTPTNPGSPDSAATGSAPGTNSPGERPQIPGNVPPTTPGGPAAPQTSGPDPAQPSATPTVPDKQTPSPR